ncbi:MAG: glycosyltransferase family 2 protein [Thermoanaerobaculia bacterium]|nr:glycosyltransferase family 2 protein [Thermoanaerobaculia bacterium]
MTGVEILFWLCLGVCVYVYFGYPALMAVLARIRPRPVERASVRPLVTVLVPAYNEEEVIGAKIENCLELSYPRESLEVLVVSDGSTDGTDEEVLRLAAIHPDTVRLLHRERAGKAFALNLGAEAAQGEILVLTDANAMLERDALARLVEPFADPGVGGVCGRKRYRTGPEGDTTGEGEGLYWRFDQWLKERESRVGSVFAADGALYAVRRRLYVPLADPAQADDIAVSARIVLQGRRLLFEPSAVVWEEAPAEGREELRRKIRVTNHSVRALWNLGPALWSSGFYSLQLLSHKLVRHLLPFFLVPVFVTNLVLAPISALYGWLLGGQVVFYLLALAGFLLRHRWLGGWRIFSVPYYFTLVNLAAFLGVLSILKGERQARWEPRQGLAPPREDHDS